MKEATIDFNKNDVLHCDKKGSRLHCTINPKPKATDEVVHKYNAINIAGDYIEMMNEGKTALDITFEKRAVCQSQHLVINPETPRKLLGTLTCVSTKERAGNE